MKNKLLGDDIKDPCEKLIEECEDRFYFYDIGICNLMSIPCQKCIYDGQCKVLREYFRKERKQNENY